MRSVSNAPSTLAPSTLAPSILAPSTFQYERDMFGQVLRVKGYYDVMIHKHHSEDVYDLIDLRMGGAHLKGLAPK